MITKVEVFLNPSGELIELTLTRGTSFNFEVENYIMITHEGLDNIITHHCVFQENCDRMIVITEDGADFKDIVLQVPMSGVKYIRSYNS